MRHRDLAWRGLGVVVFAAAAALGAAIEDGSTALGLPAFCLALLGLVLIVQGRRVPAAFRVEGSRHRALAQAVLDRHRQRAGRKS